MYIKLEQQRFDDKFDYKINIDNDIDTKHYVIPSLLLQPFIENSIWHGFMHKKENDGMLTINLEKFGDSIICVIEDNGIGREKSKELNKNRSKTHKSLGLKITESRLRLINKSRKDNLYIEYVDLLDNKGFACGTRVKINIPIVKK